MPSPRREQCECGSSRHLQCLWPVFTILTIKHQFSPLSSGFITSSTPRLTASLCVCVFDSAALRISAGVWVWDSVSWENVSGLLWAGSCRRDVESLFFFRGLSSLQGRGLIVMVGCCYWMIHFSSWLKSCWFIIHQPMISDWSHALGSKYPQLFITLFSLKKWHTN